MSIQRGILHNNFLRHTNTEGGKVPHGLYATSHHRIGYLLGYPDRHGQHTNLHSTIILHFLHEFICVINGDTIDYLSYQRGIDIECCHYL